MVKIQNRVIERRKGKILNFAAEGAKRRDIIFDYHDAKLSRCAILYFSS